MAEKKIKEQEPGNDILNGIERWIPEENRRKPNKFRFEAPNHIWYKDKWEMATCLARAGVPQDKWCAKLENPWPDVPVA